MQRSSSQPSKTDDPTSFLNQNTYVQKLTSQSSHSPSLSTFRRSQEQGYQSASRGDFEKGGQAQARRLLAPPTSIPQISTSTAATIKNSLPTIASSVVTSIYILIKTSQTRFTRPSSLLPFSQLSTATAREQTQRIYRLNRPATHLLYKSERMISESTPP